MSQGVAVGDSGVNVGDGGVHVDDDTQECCCGGSGCNCAALNINGYVIPIPGWTESAPRTAFGPGTYLLSGVGCLDNSSGSTTFSTPCGGFYVPGTWPTAGCNPNDEMVTFIVDCNCNIVSVTPWPGTQDQIGRAHV